MKGHRPLKLTRQGYVRVWAREHPLANGDGNVLEHRKVLYDAGIAVPPGHHVHHKNGDKTDNRLENLEVLRAVDHSRHHVREKGYVDNQFGRWPVEA
jgi:HNH endonuclease